MTQQMTQPFWVLTEGHQPLVAAAIHDGHDVRAEVDELLALDKHDRRREEDPYTAAWTTVADTRLVVLRSRFEVDLNRPREKAIYLKPEDAWGLTVWHTSLPSELVARSLAEYDRFYTEVERVCINLERRFNRFVVFDLHTYNHSRAGLKAAPTDSSQHPEINLGTGTMNRQYWAPVVDTFLKDLRDFDFLGRQLDVRENIKFRGGYFPYWIHQRFPQTACVLAIEVKKFFIDEWTYQPDFVQLDAIHRALHSTVPGVLEALKRI